MAEKLQCIAEMNDSDDDEDSSDEETGKPEPKGSRKGNIMDFKDSQMHSALYF